LRRKVASEAAVLLEDGAHPELMGRLRQIAGRH